MSRPVTRLQRSLGSVEANSGNLGRGQLVGSEPNSREANQVIEKEFGSYEIVRTHISPELAGTSSFIRNLERPAMANQAPFRGGLSGQSRGLGGQP